MRAPLQVLVPIYGSNGARIGVRVANVKHRARLPNRDPFPYRYVRDGKLGESHRYRYRLPVKA